MTYFSTHSGPITNIANKGTGEARLRTDPPFDASVVKAAVEALGDMKSPYAFGGGYCEISSCSAPTPSSKGFLDNLLASIGGTSGTKSASNVKPTGHVR